MLKTIRGHRKYTTIVAVWLTLSIASVFLSAVTWRQLSKRLAEARQAIFVQDEVDAVMKLLLDGETSQRGYVITGDEAFLAPLLESEPQLSMHFDTLADLGVQDTELLDRIMQLRGQAEVLVRHHQRIVKARQEEGEAAAQKIVAEGEGKAIMDGIRNLVDGIKFQRGTLISDGGAMQRSQLLRASMTSLIAGVIGIGAGIIAYAQALLAIRHQRRERELVEARLEAERTSHEKSVFLTNMSHEIRTPMNAILGFCELLQGELTDRKHRKYLNAISTSGNSLLQLINDILDMSKIEEGVLTLKTEPTDLREICQFIQTLFIEPASRKGVQLISRVDEDMPRALLMDRVRLRQVLVNLVGNAVKFTDRGSIIMRAKWVEENSSSHVGITLEVLDTGAGIPKDSMQKIFKPFVQAGAHREKEKQGTGLGLSIVKRLTEIMGGTVTAESVLGQGSSFRLSFTQVPISNRLATSDNFEEKKPVNFDALQPAHLLVVDDNAANCQLVEGLFAGTKHRLDFAHDGRRAVEMAEQLHPDIILMDIRMPEMDGLAALDEIRQISELEMTPVLAVTASTLEREDEDLKNRFSGYIRKPFTKKQLFDELAHFLPRHDGSSYRSRGSGDDTTEGKLDHPASPELLRALQRMADEEWTTLKDALAFNECKAFAQKLAELARQHDSPRLESYADQLAQEADQYDAEAMESKLEAFPELLAELEHRGTP